MLNVAVVGGGIFGVTIATNLSSIARVELFEKQKNILSSASFVNQFRLHRGYHYPRSLSTSSQCKYYAEQFQDEYPKSIAKDHDSYYAIAKYRSKTSAKEFIKFCNVLGLEYKITDIPQINSEMVSLIIQAQEKLIDFNSLKLNALEKLKASKVVLNLGQTATNSRLKKFDKVIICAYAASNELLSEDKQIDYQFELCEKILIRMPKQFGRKSIVIMDGPFMCIDPYGNSNNFLLGNVVHAIHQTNLGTTPLIPSAYKGLINTGFKVRPKFTNFKKFVNSGLEFIPLMSKAEHVASMYTFRAVLPERDSTDERPTIVREVDNKYISVFSGKIANCVEATENVSRIILRHVS